MSRGGRRAAGLMVALAGAACAGPRPASRAVAIQGFRFGPDTLTVSVGDTVVWSNGDVVPHTATAIDSAGRWDTGRIDPRGSGRWVAARPGTHRYVCAYHPSMQGVVEVR